MSGLDPILSAIAAHRAAWTAYVVALDATDGARFRSKAEARRHAARDAFRDATEALTATPIATLAGARAFLRYVSGYAAPGMPRRNLDALAWWDLADALRAIDRFLSGEDATEPIPLTA